MRSLSANFARIVFLLTCVAFAASCAGNKPAETGDTPTAPSVEENTLGDSDSGRAQGLLSINFPYDSFTLDATAKGNLKTNADIMQDKSSLKIQIEGHCDQRGGIQYNIALGEKRANAVKNYLEGLGVAADRVTTISYGKERPLDPGTSEDAYAKNRRANFVITAR